LSQFSYFLLKYVAYGIIFMYRGTGIARISKIILLVGLSHIHCAAIFCNTVLVLLTDTINICFAAFTLASGQCESRLKDAVCLDVAKASDTAWAGLLQANHHKFNKLSGGYHILIPSSMYVSYALPISHIDPSCHAGCSGSRCTNLPRPLQSVNIPKPGGHIELFLYASNRTLVAACHKPLLL
jgi:hypothetical protein